MKHGEAAKNWSRRLPRQRERHGFTLIELLVVIAVIVILAALLLPTLSSSQRSAVDISCVSNLSQIAKAFQYYINQHKGFMPPSGSPGAPPPRRFPRWHLNLEPFIRVEKQAEHSIFACPSKDSAKYGYGLNHMWNGPDHIYPGRAMNDRTKEIDQVLNPAGTLIIADTGLLANNTDSGTYTDTSIPVEEWVETPADNVNGCTRYPYDNKLGEPGNFIWWHQDPRRPFPRHGIRSNKTNFMFFDSHVQAIETADVVDDLWGEPDCLYDNEGVPPPKF